MLESGAAEHDSVERLGSHTVVASRIPLRERGVTRGALLACHDASARPAARSAAPLPPPPAPVRGALLARRHRRRLARLAPRRELAEEYARTDATVLITGESGTGKELFAQGIHAASRRAKHPFVAINCAAFPETLLESELFGYEEGAFTGSRRGGRPGLFEAAHLGTIFLDEIGDLPVTLQTRLLRVLQERQVLRLGSNDPTPVDVRVVAATHRDLRQAMAAGQFRTDLYFRLHILPLHLPALRERPGDVAASPPSSSSARWPATGRPGCTPGRSQLLPRLDAYAWPGNVRELENVIERVALLYADDTSRAVGDDELAAVMPELFQSGAPAPALPSRDLRAARAAREREHVQRVLAECRGNQSEAARRLGIGRSTLYRKLAGRA